MGNYWIEDLNVIMEKITGFAIEVHRNLAGLLESIYENALFQENKKDNSL